MTAEGKRKLHYVRVTRCPQSYRTLWGFSGFLKVVGWVLVR
jgi:hypothetical protein